MNDNLVGYAILGKMFVLLSFCSISFHILLVHEVSFDRSDIHLMDFPLYISSFFFVRFVCFVFCFLGHTWRCTGVYSWLCTQELPLAMLRGPYGMLGIVPGSAACKANALPAVLPLQPPV